MSQEGTFQRLGARTATGWGSETVEWFGWEGTFEMISSHLPLTQDAPRDAAAAASLRDLP